MSIINYLSKPLAWVIPWLIQVIVYCRLLKKMGLTEKWWFIPFADEKTMSDHFFRYKSTFWHVLIMSGTFMAGGLYLRYTRGNVYAKIIGIVFTAIGMLIYSLFLAVLYQRICKAFHKKRLFRFLTFLFPMPFLFYLGGKKAVFYGFPKYKQYIRNKYLRGAARGVGELVYAGQAFAIISLVFNLSTTLYPPRPMVYMQLTEKEDQIAGLKGDGRVTSRYDTTSVYPFYLDEIYKGRDLFFPDHSNDESVVVLEYIIGSNLEDTYGLSTYNIDQMKNATKQGSSLKFVLEAGGSYRWFTRGIKDETVGRYEIADGGLKKVVSLDENISMSYPDELYDFLAWAKKEYPADRYMLVFWDHGGGLSSGYGSDDLNKRDDTAYGTMLVNEIVEALEKADMKFDLIGFDACLMQDIEIAKALEPYADYYLASQETESGDGWYYTSGFGMLAQDPTTSTRDFAKEMISSFDLYNAIAHNGEAQTNTTLSLVDLTKVNDTYNALEDFYDQFDKAIREDSSNYADISLAASNAYVFTGNEQIDLIDFLQKLDSIDYDDTVISSQEINALIQRIRSMVIYHNAVSTKGINGICVTFPYDSLSVYGDEHFQYEELKLDRTKNFFDDYFSVMAYMNRGASSEIFGIVIEAEDHTQDEWYNKEFDGYADIPLIQNVPLTEKDGAYQIDLDYNVWKIIGDSRQIVYMKTDDGWRYLGQDVPGAYDEKDRPMVSTDGTWIHINNNLVSYEAVVPVEAEWGVIHRGTVKGRLNGEREILLQIEWEPIEEDSPQEVVGKVTGYTFADSEWLFMERGINELSPGDSLEFLFDVYDDEGQYLRTETYGKKLNVSSMESLKVKDAALPECDIRYGVVLTDIFQRTFTTEFVETHLPR